MKFAAESVMSPRELRRRAGLSLFIHLSIKEKVDPSLTANASDFRVFQMPLRMFFQSTDMKLGGIVNYEVLRAKKS